MCWLGPGALVAGQPDLEETHGGAEGGGFQTRCPAEGHGEHAGPAAAPVRPWEPPLLTGSFCGFPPFTAALSPVRPRERREAERKLEELKKNRSIAVGRQRGFEEEILHYRWERWRFGFWFQTMKIFSLLCRKELREDQYEKADERHKNKMIAMRTTELVIKDLDLYYKALDQ